VAGFYGLRLVYRRHRTEMAAERVRVAGLLERADRQYRYVLAGDPVSRPKWCVSKLPATGRVSGC
jgi:hypothetical protein